jgi:soluble lytic murein transglycosylase-like protein
MRRVRPIILGALFAGALGLPATAAADNFYACPSPDGGVMYTNLKKGKSCKVFTKGGSSRPSISRQTFVRSGGRVERDWSVYDPIIKEAAQRYNLPQYLLKAVIVTESSLDPYAVSSAGAEGLMQLMPGTAADMQVTDSFDPKENIMGGARYLRVLANMFDGDLVMMIAGYNAGHNRVLKSGGKIPNIAETRDYVRKVLRQYFRFKKEFLSEQASVSEKTESGT